MNKVLEETLISDYPGLVRTTQLFDGNIIEIEFNSQYSNEIGIRFWKKFVNAKEENIHLQSYFKNTKYLDKNLEITDSIVNNSFKQLILDTINNSVFLPDNGYYYKGDILELKANLEHPML